VKTKHGAIVAAGLILSFCPLQSRAGWVVQQITTNNVYDFYPSLYNGTIAWQGWDGSDLEIYYWNGSTIQQITNNSVDDIYPSPYNGTIAWQHWDGSDWEIYYWNGSTIQQITDNSVNDYSPSLYNGAIAWYASDGSDGEIYYWNGSTIQQISDNSEDDYYPSLYNGTIAWAGWDGSDYEIYYWNGSTIQPITDNSVHDFYPSLYNGTIAWHGMDGSDYEIYYWNGSTIQQITDNSVDDWPPSLYNGTIAWVGWDGSDREIYYWNGSTIQQITDNSEPGYAPSLYNGTIAWRGWDGSDYEIYYAYQTFDLRIERFDAAGRLTFSELPTAALYRVQFSTNLCAPSWSTNPPGIAEIPGGGAASRTVTVGVDRASCFFRVAAEILPGPPAGMRTIAGGSFGMGNWDNPGEGGAEELPVHAVYVSPFHLDQREITWTQWCVVRDWALTNGYEDLAGVGSAKGDLHPVEYVGWRDCLKWCNARSQLEGLVPCYTNADGSAYTNGMFFDGGCNWSADGYRLPTEAEWEYAARGGAAGHRFPWSDAETISHDRANYNATGAYGYDEDSDGYHPDWDDDPEPYTAPAGSFAPNGFGLFDMAGNVAEWCWDTYQYDYYASSPPTDPRGPEMPMMDHVVRGGGWGDDAYSARVAHRGAWPDTTPGRFGFRCARSLPAGLTPTLTSFAINGGDASTTNRTVTLDNTASGAPTACMASENPFFTGAAWQPYAQAPSFTLSATAGVKTVYFKVRNAVGQESVPLSDSIDRRLPVWVITTNSVEDYYPSLYNGTIAWRSSAGSGGEIYYWNGSTIQQITTNSVDDDEPSLYNGTIAWQGWDGSDWEIYYWNGSTIQQITTNSVDDRFPSLHNGTIAWEGWDGSDYEIYYWNGSTIQQITTNSVQDYEPSLYNGTIAWAGWDGSDLEIYYWNGSTIQQITTNSVSDGDPSLYNGTIAWAGWDGSDLEIYYWNGSTIQQITDNSVNDWSPSLYNGTIAWIAFDGSDYEIYFAHPE
jgi:formylglycine-generating enzyme required for sulfatase activity